MNTQITSLKSVVSILSVLLVKSCTEKVKGFKKWYSIMFTTFYNTAPHHYESRDKNLGKKIKLCFLRDIDPLAR